MRLDHLLSKEHWHLELAALSLLWMVGLVRYGCPGGLFTAERAVGVAHGWIIDYLALFMWWLSLVLVLPFFGVGSRNVGRRVGGVWHVVGS